MKSQTQSKSPLQQVFLPLLHVLPEDELSTATLKTKNNQRRVAAVIPGIAESMTVCEMNGDGTVKYSDGQLNDEIDTIVKWMVEVVAIETGRDRKIVAQQIASDSFRDEMNVVELPSRILRRHHTVKLKSHKSSVSIDTKRSAFQAILNHDKLSDGGNADDASLKTLQLISGEMAHSTNSSRLNVDHVLCREEAVTLPSMSVLFLILTYSIRSANLHKLGWHMRLADINSFSI